MDNISGIGASMGGAPAQKIRQAYAFTSQPAQTGDTVELSNDVMTVRGVDKVKMDRIMEIRQQLKDGTYLTPQKLDSALDNALDALFGGK